MRDKGLLFNRPNITDSQPFSTPFVQNSQTAQAFSRRNQTDKTFQENYNQTHDQPPNPALATSSNLADENNDLARYISTSRTNVGKVMTPSANLGNEPSIGGPQGRMAPAVAGAAGTSGGAAGSQAMKFGNGTGNTSAGAGKAATFAGKMMGAGVSFINKNRDIGFQAQTANIYFNTMQGGQGVWHGMGHHATQEAMARDRVGQRMNLATDFGSAFGGPVGGLIGYFVGNGLKDKWMGDEMSKINYENAWTSSGKRIDSRYAPTSTYRGKAEQAEGMREAKPGESVSRSNSIANQGESSSVLPTLDKELTPTPVRAANARMTTAADVHNADNSSIAQSDISHATDTSLPHRGNYEVNPSTGDSITPFDEMEIQRPPSVSYSNSTSINSSTAGSYSPNDQPARFADQLSLSSGMTPNDPPSGGYKPNEIVQ